LPNIREISAPRDLGLQPSDRAAESTAGSGRRIASLYGQAAEAISDTGRRAQSAINDVGDVAVKYLDHREISAGAAKFAELQYNLTDQWNKIAKDSDPNDPSIAAKFREEVVEPQLQKFQSGFNTENSQKFAEQKSESLRTHMFEKTAADQAQLAGIAVRKNINDSTTLMSNTAIADPSSVPSLIANVEHSIGAMVDSSPTLTPAAAATAKADLSQAAKAAIIKAGAIGAIQKSGDPEATAAEWIKKYPEYINGAEAQTLGSNARQQIRARNYDDQTNRTRQKQATQDLSTDKANQYLIDVRSKDPKLVGDPTANKILNDPELTKTDKNNLLNLVDRQLKPETDARLSQQSFVSLLRELRAPDADPDKVMQKAWDARLMDPGKPGSMSEKDFNQFRSEIVDRKTPTGAALEHDRAQFFKNYGTAIAGVTYTPAVGDPKVYNAEMDARRVENDLKKKGLDPHLAYDPASPYFLGDPKRISKWSTSMQQDLATFGERFGAASPQGVKSVNLTAGDSKIISMETTVLPPAEPAKRTIGNSYDTPKGKMVWTGTGWVKP
jgi:hypothetical protein